MVSKLNNALSFHRRLALPALLCTAVWLGGAALLDRWVISPYNAASIAEAASARAESEAAQLAAILEKQKRQLQALAAGAFRTAKENRFDAGSRERLQFFSQSELRVGAGSAPQLNFALLDLIKRTLEEGPQPVEILRTGSNSNWQQHQAAASGEGVVLLTRSFDHLQPALESLADSAGERMLLQQFPGGPAQTLWQAGQGSGLTARAPVAGSHLTLAFQPGATFASDNSIGAGWIYSVGLLGLLVSLGALWRFVHRYTQAPWEQRGKRPRQAGGARGGRASVPAGASAPESATVEPTSARDQVGDTMEFPEEVFRAYDIRGLAGSQINEPFAYQLGRALGTLAQHAGEELLMVARDGRNSSELLSRCLVEGILDTGCNAVDLGLAPSPLLYFACARGTNSSSGVIVTASHNPAEYNGFKIVLKGRSLAEDKLQKLRTLMQSGPFDSGEGSYREQDIREHYIDEIFNDVALAGQPRLVIDAGNGATANLAPQLFEQLGCSVTPLFCEVDGNFPNHPPDPSRPENLQALIDKVAETGAELGVALDGDGDRVTLVSGSGRIAWADQLVMLLARDVLARNPGEDIVFDVKCSRVLNELVNQYGGRPVMWKTGHAPMKNKMQETGAILGGELSGHIFIKDRWFGFDDGMYAAARVLEIMALREQSLDELLDSLPQMASTPEILLPVEEKDKFALIEKLKKQGQFKGADINTIDGLRIEFPEGWGLVRASNTGAALTLRFEAESHEALQRIFSTVREQLQAVAPQLSLPDL
ncbi:phosphomannomutase/phosphoglucomutase [Microbulbifer flavimaris]|uniref:phosphomannomutase n=1 Tax=Microbulbifer flavimaris TaxID=1781068 RepID=A0ABX4I140_9GAMM|nr:MULTISPECIES: phosphomannomutase/phosphoglucomutase [Microbulbifer]KUJ83927.1 phosphomannomutase [Microbulbifer sp. ZGT114]PCO06104.1 phosphomannomutase/phosphoglucomutase [Microbulbifer flavimaris]